MRVLEILHSKNLSRNRSLTALAKNWQPLFPFVVGIAMTLVLFNGSALVFASQDDGPKELPKPKLKTTPPLFKDWNFDKDHAGSQPLGFVSVTESGQAEGKWLVTKETSAPTKSQAVIQNADCSDDSCYHLLLGDGTEVTYVDVSVRMKLLLGTPSGKAGLVLGAKDNKNFYAAVVTPETNTVEAFLVRDGVATSFGKSGIKPNREVWHTLRVQRSPMISHDLFNVFFDKHMILSLSDSTLKEGKVGLVTWGKGAFAFDNLRAVEYLTNLPFSRPPAY